MRRVGAAQAVQVGVARDPELTDAIYLRERARLERIIADEPVPTAQVLDLTKAMASLSDMPKLIEAANVPQRRALVRQVFEQIWLEKKVTAVKPSPQFGLLLEAVVSGTISTGVDPALANYPLECWRAFEIAFG